VLSVIPTIGGSALELFNAVIAPPIERRRNDWLNKLAERVQALEQRGRVRVADLANNDEFVSAVMQATAAAVRNHQQEKIEALRNAVLNTALGQSPEDAKRELFLAFVDQFTVLHLRVLKDLSAFGPPESQSNAAKTRIGEIAELAMKRLPALRDQSALAETVVEDLCRRGLLNYWPDGDVAYVPRGCRQVSPFGEEFLQFITEPQE
jgi:hypothetical protein